MLATVGHAPDTSPWFHSFKRAEPTPETDGFAPPLSMQRDAEQLGAPPSPGQGSVGIVFKQINRQNVVVQVLQSVEMIRVYIMMMVLSSERECHQGCDFAIKILQRIAETQTHMRQHSSGRYENSDDQHTQPIAPSAAPHV